jgi:hypothetical protein
LSFCIQFFKQHVNIAFKRALAFVIKRKITLARDVYSRPPITIRFHGLHVGNVKGALGEIAPTMRGTSSLLSLVHASCTSFGLSLAYPFIFHVMVLVIIFYWMFCAP